MAVATKKWIALIRAIGPTTHKKMSMQALRDACVLAGLTNVSTYIASGNLLFSSSKPKAELMKTLVGILASYDLDNPIILRSPAELKKVLAANPHPDAAASRPNLCLVVFYDKKLNLQTSEKLNQWPGPEHIVPLSRELCIDYKEGIARSKLTPVVLDRESRQPGTARNWNTINKLIALASN